MILSLCYEHVVFPFLLALLRWMAGFCKHRRFPIFPIISIDMLISINILVMKKIR